MATTFIEFFDKAGEIVDKAAASYDLHVLTDTGMNLFWALAALIVSWRGVQFAMASGDGRSLSPVMNKVISTVFGVGFVLYMMQSGFDIIFVDGIAKSLEIVAGKLMPGGMGGGVLSQSLASMFVGFQVISQMASDIFKDVSLLDTLTVFFKNMPTLLVLMFAELLIVIGIVALFAVISVSIVMVKVAIIIAPIFIPWLLLPATSFVFMGWVRFLIAACLYQVVGAAVIFFAQNLLTNTAKLITESGNTFPESLFAALAMCALQITILTVIVKVPQIAKQLSSGQKLDVFDTFK